MAKKKILEKKVEPRPFSFIQLFLLIPLFLIAIGDTIRLVVGTIFFLWNITYKNIRLPHIPTKKKKPKIISYTIYPTLVVPFAQRFQYFVMGVTVVIACVFVPFVTYYWLRTLPNPRLLTGRDIEVTTKMYDRNGTLLYEIYTDQNRTPVHFIDIPDMVKNGTIAIEDKNFYRHPGFSLQGIARAIRETIVVGHVQGGSTITQQLIKSALLTPEVTISRKIREIFLAFWAERLYTKDQILEMYLNQVPYGGTAWGIEAASQSYFGKSVTQVNLAEAALLAGLPAAPSEYSPFGSHPEKAFERQAHVLQRMVEERFITQEDMSRALATPVHITAPRNGLRAPHFVMYVRNLLEKKYGSRLVDRGGLRIVTSLDLSLQEKVQDIVSTNIDKLASLQVGNGAALVTNPKTGEILAMVGSRDYFDLTRDGNVNVTTSLRQPGSSIKVVTYTAALENGMTAATILDDSPITYPQLGGAPYTPINYDGRFHGRVPLRIALGNSYNVPAVKTLATIGLPTMIEKARAMGITSWEDESRFGLSLTLGGGEVTMTDMAVVYGTLANMGERVNLSPILEITDYTGRVIEKNTLHKIPEAVKPEVAWIMSDILRDNNARSSAFGPNSQLVIAGKSVSVKTGTTNEKRDNWTIGFTPSVVAAVWVGNNNNAPMHPTLTSGVTGAAPIWHDIMTEVLKDKPDQVPPKPDGVIAIPCYLGRTEYFVKGTEPHGGRCIPLPTPIPSPTP
ncbi:hypothetical protein A2971_04960 [Candidatus Gottesmanbacteria bacterium RIFCSPLOWO2_01_FULL_46_21]|uniref:Uncharacterized protein n=1 Tax=Candidatus Gottesmanbacteria bacterium RIFCSPLOWO2_01_FULL_46_21 TaxID=1798393 RepID=A0A1F6AWA5_9BACT|nr:MAG: hypothetical protein A2971_04960 [Candidatus Gottesmanbacteria bacterium RIFCSPLOWO2_01_FULL_46_21]